MTSKSEYFSIEKPILQGNTRKKNVAFNSKELFIYRVI